MVKPGDLQDRSEPSWENIRGEADVRAAIQGVKGERPEPLEARIAKARALTPPEGSEPESWVAGRDAALKAIAG
jgi:hypothetical protein